MGQGRTATGIIAALVALAMPVAAHASDRLDPTRFPYTAPATCPSRESFLDEVQTRTPRAPEADRTYLVEVTQGESESRGRLVVRASDGAETEREVTGDTCGEVVSALALITALAIDPNARTTPVPPAPPPAPPPLAPSAPVPDAITPPPARRETWALAVSAEASAVAGVAPRWVLGVPLALHVSSPYRGVLSPSVHLGVERATSGSIDVAGASAAFRWTSGILEGCPVRLQHDDLRAEPCLRFEAGVLEGAGSNIVPAREDARAWAAVGATARGEWTVARPLFLELEAGVRLPITRTTYYFQPDSFIYQPPSVAGVVGAGVGARFL